MRTVLGNSGVERDYTWQDPWPDERPCADPNCGGTAKIMFVAYEGIDIDPADDEPSVCTMRLDELKDDDTWPHDHLACAVYWCLKCTKVEAVVNQA